MNVLTAPKFLRREEPQPPAMPQTQPSVSPEVAAFIDSTTRQREELAYLRSENDTLNRELRLANERIRMLDEELTHTRNARDWFCRHDAFMLATLDDIEAMIVARKAKARAEAYAPPGSGQEDHTQNGDELAAGVADLAAKLAPGPDNA